MLVFIARRMVSAFLTLVVASFFVYIFADMSGDPLAGAFLLPTEEQRQAQVAAITAALNLDQPVIVRYFNWLGGALTGDFGLTVSGQSVNAIMANALPATLQLVAAATVLTAIVGVAIGIISALRQYSGFDYGVTVAAFVGISLPIFWIAIMLKEFGAIRFNNWLVDPTIPPPVVALLAVATGVVTFAVMPGEMRRRAVGFAIGAAAGGAIAWLISATRWFADPAIGFWMIAIMSAGAAVGFATLFTGLDARKTLTSALVTAAVGSLVYLIIGPVMREPDQFNLLGWNVPGFLVILALGLVAVGVAVYIGDDLGGLERRQAIGASVWTALFCGGLIVLDFLLQAAPTYMERVRGRPISTIGPSTPNFQGGFWETWLDSAGHLILPSIALVAIGFGIYTRYVRSSMLNTKNQDYVRTARAKGLPERTVVYRHTFRNALIPVTTLVALAVAGIISGAVITETVFGWQGMGKVFLDALRITDANPLMAITMVSGVAVVLMNLVADIAYGFLDPRIRVS